ncbi:PIN domain-containing protein [Cupriavidus sp. AcVe19-6a]|uniref:PIN domain-containing protein n=1 Tax=Cupriavidus sp. AcVe19-6a TaxID=2821358 RepID=UPI001AEA5966|nr:PIN domain-containing protein [Cupriavidus sp. AcVe19-6a]MBP0639211.1 PIN domain-containing protein [Cupriavidus sp. AcVe19-6a]
MTSNFAVVYDACVLYPASLGDLLMRLAVTDLYRAKWTNQIHDEWIRNLLARRPELSADRLAGTRELMNRSVRDSLVFGYEHLIESIELPDPDDRHVVAAAIHSGSERIITFNMKDFPASRAQGVQRRGDPPDDVVVDLFDLNAGKVLAAVAKHRASLKNPPKSPSEYLTTLSAQGLTQTVLILTQYSLAI